MVAAPPRPGRRAAAPSAAPSKYVCFRAGTWRYALAVDEIHGLYTGLPLIPSTEEGCTGVVQLPLGRIPVLDLRPVSRQSENLPSLALVVSQQQTVALVFEHADEVLPVQQRGWLSHSLDIAPLPSRARTITPRGDVFWLNVQEVIAKMNCRILEK